MTPLVASLSCWAAAALGATLGFVIGGSFASAEIRHWRMRAEQLHRRLQAARSSGREIDLFDNRHAGHAADAHQETPSG